MPSTVSGGFGRSSAGSAILPPIESLRRAPTPAAIACCDRVRIVDAEEGDVVELLAQDLGEHRGRVHRAARGAIVVMVEEKDRRLLGWHRLGARDGLGQGLDLEDEVVPRRPGVVQKLIDEALRRDAIAIRGDDGAQARLANIGVREADEECGRKGRALLLPARCLLLQGLVGRLMRALRHHMGKHRHIAPRHHGARLAPDRLHEKRAGAARRLRHVGVRIKVIAGDDRRKLDDVLIDIGVHVERDGDRHLRVDGTNAAQELALAILHMLGDHRAVKIEHQAVEAAFRDRIRDRLGAGLISRALHGSARRRARRDRHHDLRPDARRDIEEATHASAGAAVMRDRGFSEQGGVAFPAKPRDRRRHRREGVRLVRELRDQETHQNSLDVMPGLVQPCAGHPRLTISGEKAWMAVPILGPVRGRP